MRIGFCNFVANWYESLVVCHIRTNLQPWLQNSYIVIRLIRSIRSFFHRLFSNNLKWCDKLPKHRRDLVLFRKDWVRNVPIDVQVGVVPTDAAFRCLVVDIGAFVGKH